MTDSHRRHEPGNTVESPDGDRSSTSRQSLLLSTMAALATVCAATALMAVIKDTTWFGHILFVTLMIGATGWGLRRWRIPPPVVPFVQALVLLLLLTGLFTANGLAGFVPGPAAVDELHTLLSNAGKQVYRELPPVAATPEIRCLLVIALGVVAIVVDTLVAHAKSAVAGFPLLGVYAVPAALTAELLPWWTFTLAVTGFAALLAAEHAGRHHDGTATTSTSSARRRPAVPVTVLTVTIVAGLVVGSTFTVVGTSGQLPGSTPDSARPVAGGGYGVHPFTRLRGLLQHAESVPMFQVRGMGSHQRLLRAFTLSDYRSNEGWTLPDGPMPQGVPATSELPPTEGTSTNRKLQTIRIEPRDWNDVWLPVYGTPTDIRDLSDDWIYDADSGTVFREQSSSPAPYTEIADIGQPSKPQLRRSDGKEDAVSVEYTELDHVDDRVARLAETLTADATTRYDKTRAIWQHFEQDNGFEYRLETPPATDDNAMADFLFHGKSGYCEQYASAMAVLLRSLDIPTRVAVGFTPGERDGDHRTITTDDAHAWVEVYFPDIGWVDFDPTPLTDGRGFTPDYLQQDTAADDTSATEGTTAAQPQSEREDPTERSSAEPVDSDHTTSGSSTGILTRAPAWHGWASGGVAALALGLSAVLLMVRRRVDRRINSAAHPRPTTMPLARWLPSITTATWSLALLLGGWQLHWLVGAALALLGALALSPATIRETRLRRRLTRLLTTSSRAPEAAWRELRDTCRDREIPVMASDTLRVIAQRISETDSIPATAGSALETIVGGLEHAWYAPAGSISPTVTAGVSDLATAVVTLRNQWARAAPLPLHGRILPRSVTRLTPLGRTWGVRDY